MRLNADFSEVVVVDSSQEPWRASPLPGVERRMLDRIGDEVARATSIVRYAPNSFFSAHTHGGGEEFLVLEGVFSDEHGDYGPGAYIRNPPGTSHTPFSRDGCTIFVKLQQMRPDDQADVSIDSQNVEWRREAKVAVETLKLHSDQTENVWLIKVPSGKELALKEIMDGIKTGGGEILVLDGRLKDDLGEYGANCWLRFPSGREPALKSTAETTCYIKTGHLADVTSGLASAG